MIRKVTADELRENLDEVLSDIEAGTSITIVREGRWVGTLGANALQRGMRHPSLMNAST